MIWNASKILLNDLIIRYMWRKLKHANESIFICVPLMNWSLSWQCLMFKSNPGKFSRHFNLCNSRMDMIIRLSCVKLYFDQVLAERIWFKSVVEVNIAIRVWRLITKHILNLLWEWMNLFDRLLHDMISNR
jgi:hypothetical protein